MTEAPDSIVRAMTDDGAFRVIAARTTQTAREAVAVQKARGNNAERFGDLLTGAVLYRETMAPGLRVQAVFTGAAGRGRLVADSHPDGSTRGLVTAPDGAGDVVPGPGATLLMMRTLPNGGVHKGMVGAPLGATVSTSLMEYMQASEQVVSMIAVATVLGPDGAVHSAGGYILQLLPEVGEGPLMVMTERLKDFERVHEMVRDPNFSPDGLIGELLYRMPFTRLEENPLRFGCHCSAIRVVASLATLPRAEIEELLRAGEVLEVGCDYCGEQYKIPPAQLRGLLDRS